MSEAESFIISRRDELFDQLLISIHDRFGEEFNEPPVSLGTWAEKTPIVLDGKPFSFHRHEYLREPYEDAHPHVVEMKAAQMGLTSKAMLKAIYGARYRNYKGILYLFPSKTDVTDFSKGRIDPLIGDNPEVIGKWIRETDAANIKKVWNSFIYLRGMNSRVGLKSIPDSDAWWTLSRKPEMPVPSPKGSGAGFTSTTTRNSRKASTVGMKKIWWLPATGPRAWTPPIMKFCMGGSSFLKNAR